MRAKTATRLLVGILGFMLVVLALGSLSGDREARSLFPQFLVLTITIAGIASPVGARRSATRRTPRSAAGTDRT